MSRPQRIPDDVRRKAESAVASWRDGCSPPTVDDLMEVIAGAILSDRAERAVICEAALPDSLQRKADKIEGAEREFWRGAAHAQLCISNALLGLPPPLSADD